MQTSPHAFRSSDRESSRVALQTGCSIAVSDKDTAASGLARPARGCTAQASRTDSRAKESQVNDMVRAAYKKLAPDSLTRKAMDLSLGTQPPGTKRKPRR